MSISSIAPNTNSPQTWQNAFQQRRQDFSQLAQALQSGDLSGAQQAFSELQGLQSNNPAGTNTNTNSSGNPIANTWAALGQALSSGNLTQAQSDFAQFQSDAQSANQSGAQGTNRAHHGHHHHHAQASSSQDSNSATDSTTGSATGSSDASTTGSVNIQA